MSDRASMHRRARDPAETRDLPRRRRRWYWRLIRACLFLGFLGAICGGIGAAWFLQRLDRTPREWAPYIARRAWKHRPLIENSAALVSDWLIYADRMAEPHPLPIPPLLGASPGRSGPTPAGPLHVVASQDALRAALAAAKPGDVIELAPGVYRFEGDTMKLDRPGTAALPIYLRAARLGDVVIETRMVETFKLFAPFWHIENLTVRGVCNGDEYCEHAFHIVGGGSDAVFRNNRFEDFNAQLKINGENGAWPDRGLVVGNSFVDNRPRMTLNPITPIDLVGADDWLVRDNFIADFVRGDTAGNATYGAYFKGGGSDDVMERNLVVCEWKLRGVPGQRVGLSLGGGGSIPGLRRDNGASGLESTRGVLRDNLIVGCSDDGIYVNNAVRSVIEHNTLIDTAGIDVRFPASSARIDDNIVDGVIRTRDGGQLTAEGNESANLLGLFVGYHPQRRLFRDPATLDLTWRNQPQARMEVDAGTDLCGHKRGERTLPGAFDDFTRCQ